MPCGEDQSPTRSGDVPYPLSRCDKSCGCARRVYASPLRILLTVRRIADLEGNGVIGLLETHVLKQILHPERMDSSCSTSSSILYRLFSAPWEVQVPATPDSESRYACCSRSGFTEPEFSRARPPRVSVGIAIC